MSTSSLSLPTSGWKTHSEQSDIAAIVDGAWGITTELECGVVVMSRIEPTLPGQFFVTALDAGYGVLAYTMWFKTARAAKAQHYALVDWLVACGKIGGYLVDPDQ